MRILQIRIRGISLSKRVYIDMDGTLCRFHDTEHQYIERMWEKGFYLGLKPFEEFVNAISLLINRNPNTDIYILSAVLPTDPPFIEDEKRRWVHEYLPQLPDERLIFVPAGTDKSQYIGDIDENCFLIDDYNKNLREWEQAGGFPIKFINDINNKGLGAYGGEKGQLWNGFSIEHNHSAMSICLELENTIGVDEHSYEYYNFDGDVSPEKFVALINPYFQMRNKVDENIKRQLFRRSSLLTDYSTADNTSIKEISENHAKALGIAFFQTDYKVDKYMTDCLESCYMTAVVQDVPSYILTHWLETSLMNGTAFNTYPVTPSNIAVYVNSRINQERYLNALYGEIKGIFAEFRAVEKQLMLPTVDDVANNLIYENHLYKSLCSRNEKLTEQLRELKAEWKSVAGADYPNTLHGKKTQKFIPVANRKALLK